MPAKKQATTQQDLLGKLTSAGSEAMQRLGDVPGGKALMDTAQAFRERLDEMGTRIRAIDPLERRVAALEKRLELLEKKAARPRTTTAKTKAKTKV